MNEAPRSVSAPHRARLVSALGALAVVVGLAASCAGNPLLHSRATAVPQIPRCADLVARAIASPNVVVAGAFNCFDSTNQAAFATNQPPVTDDQSLAVWAAEPPAYTHESYWGQGAVTHDYYFNLTGQGVPPACLHVAIDSQGLVSGGGLINAPCPVLASPSPK